MTKSICGADCEKCGYGKNNNCRGCTQTNGCPFGKRCFIAQYIKIGGIESFYQLKKKLIEEFNSLNVPGLKIEELYPLNGAFVNLAYPLPSGKYVKFLEDDNIYLGNQVECEFGGDSCYGLVAGMDFLLVCTYGEGGTNPEIVIYKKR